MEPYNPNKLPPRKKKYKEEVVLVIYMYRTSGDGANSSAGMNGTSDGHPSGIYHDMIILFSSTNVRECS
jgi:hypothetical protein